MANRKTESQSLHESLVFDIGFWRELAPKFSIGSKIDTRAFALTDTQKEKYNKKLVREGYVHLANPGLSCPFDEVAKTFTEIVSRGLPPVFFFVYDEPWILNQQLSNLLKRLLHKEYAMLPDFWAWQVLPGETGWKPHRDKIAGSLFPDKRPKSLTIWIPITKAHPLNGCMYVIPADRDEEYGMENSVRGIAELSEIRALPAEAGDVLVWTQHLFHWSGHSADIHDLPPRMSIAFEYQRRDVPPFRKPLLEPSALPNFEERLALIGKQVMQYRHMYGYHQDLTNLAETIAKKYALPKGLGEDH